MTTLNLSAFTSLSRLGRSVLALPSRRPAALFAALLFFAMAAAPGLRAQTPMSWSNIGTGDWTVAGNWSTGVPTGSTDAVIANGGTATLAAAGTVSEFKVGSGGGSSGSFSLTGGTLSAGSNSVIGFSGGTGTATVSGGTWSNTSNSASSFIVGHIGGTGSLTISGGAVVSLDSKIGYGGTGNVTVSSGSWSAGSLYVGVDAVQVGAGVLTISGGTVTASTVNINYSLGYATSTGTVNLNGGVLAMGGMTELTDGGHVNFNGGTLRATGSTASILNGFETGDVQIAAGGAVVDTQAFNVGIAPVLQGTGGVTKQGTGTLTLSGAHTYTGATTVSAGTLNIGGSIATSSLTTVNSGGILSGSGTVGPLLIASGGTLSPGNSPGTISAGTTTFAGGGSLLWEINSVSGTAGATTGWDLLSISGALNIAATSGSKFSINLTSLTAGNVAGTVSNFSSSANYSFLLASTTTGITGFDANAFTLDTGAFSNAFTGTWSIAQNGNNLNLVYSASAIPEPSTYAAIAGAVMLGFAVWRRRNRRNSPAVAPSAATA